jgi:3-hydroxyisobutyrate dehydrogenase
MIKDQQRQEPEYQAMKEDQMNVTILGAGAMGSAMAYRLVDTGHQVTIWNRNPDRLKSFDGTGVSVAEDAAAAVADAAIVITMVTNGDAVYAVAEQMLAALSSAAIWVQASTVGAQWADRLRALADAHDRIMLDGPVSGSTQPARTGKLSWLISGPTCAVEGARPVLDALGERVLVVGSGQEGSRLKLVVNTWMTAATVAMADSLAACERLGLAPSALLQVLSDGPLGMPYALQKAQLMIEKKFNPGFPVELALKDIRLTEEAEGLQPPLIHTVEERLARAGAEGHAKEDVAAVAAVA